MKNGFERDNDDNDDEEEEEEMEVPADCPEECLVDYPEAIPVGHVEEVSTEYPAGHPAGLQLAKALSEFLAAHQAAGAVEDPTVAPAAVRTGTPTKQLSALLEDHLLRFPEGHPAVVLPEHPKEPLLAAPPQEDPPENSVESCKNSLAHFRDIALLRRREVRNRAPVGNQSGDPEIIIISDDDEPTNENKPADKNATLKKKRDRQLIRTIDPPPSIKTAQMKPIVPLSDEPDYNKVKLELEEGPVVEIKEETIQIKKIPVEKVQTSKKMRMIVEEEEELEEELEEDDDESEDWELAMEKTKKRTKKTIKKTPMKKVRAPRKKPAVVVEEEEEEDEDYEEFEDPDVPGTSSHEPKMIPVRKRAVVEEEDDDDYYFEEFEDPNIPSTSASKESTPRSIHPENFEGSVNKTDVDFREFALGLRIRKRVCYRED